MNARPSTIHRITIAEIARQNNIDPKVARRRLRKLADKKSLPTLPDNHTDERVSWECLKRQVDMIVALIS